MKTIPLLLLCWVLAILTANAQLHETITVKAGTKVIDYFPFNERYLYPAFINGKVNFRDGTNSAAKLNYDILLGQIVFIQKKDTLAIAKVKDIDYVETAQDTFFYYNGYLEVIAGQDPAILVVKQYVKFIDVINEGAYGTHNRTGAIDTYANIYLNSNYNLILNQDIILSRQTEYYLGNKTNGFLLCKKKNVLKLFPKHKSNIESYLRKNPVDYNVKDDLIRLTGFLQTIK